MPARARLPAHIVIAIASLVPLISGGIYLAALDALVLVKTTRM